MAEQWAVASEANQKQVVMRSYLQMAEKQLVVHIFL